jgi:hypothetical protein
MYVWYVSIVKPICIFARNSPALLSEACRSIGTTEYVRVYGNLRLREGYLSVIRQNTILQIRPMLRTVARESLCLYRAKHQRYANHPQLSPIR